MPAFAWNTHYYSVISALLLALSVVAFSDNLLTDVGQPSNRDPKFIVHGLFGLAWYGLLFTQATLVRRRNVRLHRRLGTATFVVAAGVTLSTLFVFVVVWKGWAAMAPDVRANRLLLPGFALCLFMAWRWRAQPAWHKRLVLVGTFLMLGPVLSRAYDRLVPWWAEQVLPGLYTKTVDEIGFQVFFWGMWLGCFASLAVYDRKTLGRVHPASAAGLAWLAAAWLVAALS